MRICIYTIAIFTVGAVVGIAAQLNMRLGQHERYIEVIHAEMKLLQKNQELQAEIDERTVETLHQLSEVIRDKRRN